MKRIHPGNHLNTITRSTAKKVAEMPSDNFSTQDLPVSRLLPFHCTLRSLCRYPSLPASCVLYKDEDDWGRVRVLSKTLKSPKTEVDLIFSDKSSQVLNFQAAVTGWKSQLAGFVGKSNNQKILQVNNN